MRAIHVIRILNPLPGQVMEIILARCLVKYRFPGPSISGLAFQGHRPTIMPLAALGNNQDVSKPSKRCMHAEHTKQQRLSSKSPELISENHSGFLFHAPVPPFLPLNRSLAEYCLSSPSFSSFFPLTDSLTR